MKLHILYSSLFNFSDLEQIADLGDLAAGLGVIRLDGDIADLAQAQGLCGGDVLLQTAIQALNQLNLQVCHVNCPP